MKELDDLERYLLTQFDQLDHICKSPSPWIFLCLSAFIDYLSNLSEPQQSTDKLRYTNFIRKWYPARYGNFKYRSGMKDLPEQIYTILRSGLVHSFSLTPNPKSSSTTGRRRSFYLGHRQTEQRKHLSRFFDKSRGIDAAVFIAEDFLEDTKAAALKIIRRAKRDRYLRQRIISVLHSQPSVAGLDQGYFWS